MKHWFLPRNSDVLIVLRSLAAVTVRGTEAFAAWSSGDVAQAGAVQLAKKEADATRRRLQAELRAAFSVPLDAEDIYELSERLGAVIVGCRNAVREAEVMAMAPDAGLAEMARSLLEAVRHLEAAVASLESDDDRATAEADAAITAAHGVERGYRSAMSALLATSDVRELLGRRELYRRYARLADATVRVAERIWYAVVKQG